MGLLVEQCCCGCSLKQGTIIIAVIFLISSGVVLISIGVSFKDLDKELLKATEESIKDEEMREETKRIAKGIAIAALVIAVITFLIDLALLFGAIQEKPLLLIPWIIWYTIATAIVTILYILLAVVAFREGSSALGAFSIVATIVGGGISVYFILVVFSYYRELRNTTSQINPGYK